MRFEIRRETEYLGPAEILATNHVDEVVAWIAENVWLPPARAHEEGGRRR